MKKKGPWVLVAAFLILCTSIGFYFANGTPSTDSAATTSSIVAGNSSCEPCELRTSSLKGLMRTAQQSGAEPQTPGFTISAIQQWVQSENPDPSISWSYGTAELWATKGSLITHATFDSFGFLETLDTGIESYTFVYDIFGYPTAVRRGTGIGATDYWAFVYDSSGTVPVGYVNFENDTYHVLPPTSASAQTLNITNPYSNSGYAQLVQGMTPCEGCHATFNNNMDAARRNAGICMALATGFLLTASFSSAGILTAPTIAYWPLLKASCLSYFKIAEQQAKSNLEVCLQVNNCLAELPPMFKLREDHNGTADDD